MIEFSKIANKKIILRLSAVILSILFVVIFSGFFSSFNSKVDETFDSFFARRAADTNIVLIKITENDIEKLGSWPLKRSYYALLFDYLNKYGAKKIGLEIFLSGGLPYQSAYNELLSEKINEKKNVVLGSLLSGMRIENGRVAVDSIIYPQLKEINNDLQTGHLNFIPDDDILIPLSAQVGNVNEYAFSKALAENSFIPENNFMRLDFRVNADSFESYSLLRFFDLANKKDISLNRLKNKIVIIGVSDPSTAKMFDVPFLGKIPGLIIHAVAVENLLTQTWLNRNYFTLSTFLFALLLLIPALADKRFNYLLGLIILFALLIFASLIFFNNGFRLNYSALIFPFMFLLFVEMFIRVRKKEEELSELFDEAEALKKALKAKESKLAELEAQSSGAPTDYDVRVAKLKEEIDRLKKGEEDNEIFEPPEENELKTKRFFDLVYRSPKMKEVVETIEKIAPQDVTVLITGESGSGKELVARAIHNLSLRKDKNFVAVNCAALSDALLESELFGHVRGAFTNAVADKKGMFETADRGTIFLDEIGETNENFQVKLLRVLQNGEYLKVGSSQVRFTDVRVIAATNKNLEELVRENKFREDLFYRLNVIKINLPPLRERKEDVEALVEHFVKSHNKSFAVSKAVIEQLVRNDWKGNVRELESVVKRAVIFAEAEGRTLIKLGDLPKELVNYKKSDMESLIIDSLREKKFSHSSINETAKELGGLSRTMVSEYLRGFFFKEFVNNEFDLEKAAASVAASDEEEAIKKIKAKSETYIGNVEKDLAKLTDLKFESVKEKFKSKYRNLPNKYHIYLDKVIQHLISTK